MLAYITPTYGGGGVPTMAGRLVSNVRKSTGGLLPRMGSRISLGFLNSPLTNTTNGVPAGIDTSANAELSGRRVGRGKRLVAAGPGPSVGITVGADVVVEPGFCPSGFPD